MLYTSLAKMKSERGQQLGIRPELPPNHPEQFMEYVRTVELPADHPWFKMPPDLRLMYSAGMRDHYVPAAEPNNVLTENTEDGQEVR